MPDATPPDDTLADLILARLLAASSSVAAGDIERQVVPLLRYPPKGDAFATTLERLRDAGLLTRRGQSLTAEGRVRALAYLGIDGLPAGYRWATVKAKYLLPRALGLAGQDVKRFDTADRLAAHLLRKKYDLPNRTGGPKPTLQAAVCKLAGFPGCQTYAEMAAAVVSRELGEKSPLSPKVVAKVGVRLLLGAKGDGFEAMRDVALAGAFSAPEPPAPPPDLAAFAAKVLAAAKACPTGRFGRNKVFIAHVWRHLATDATVRALGLDGFKARLVEANQQRLVSLQTADLTQAFDAADLRESATAQFHSTFHFVLTGDAP